MSPFAKALCLVSCGLVSATLPVEQPARRICRPGPKKVTSTANNTVLYIGDSISIGQMGDLNKFLCPNAHNCLAHVLHGPASSGGGAVDSKYAMDVDVAMTGAGVGPSWIGNLSATPRYGDGCLNGTLLVTSLQEPVKYDLIIFNYGVHDVYYGAGAAGSQLYEEWVPLELYRSNLRAIKRTLQATGSKVLFQASTPVPYNVTTNQRIVDYNTAAKSVMAEAPAVTFHDMYKVVTDMCGQPPYNAPAYPNSPNCSVARYFNVHYYDAGWQILANATNAAVRNLLDSDTESFHAERSLRSSAPPATIKCNNTPTACPADSTCMSAGWSSTHHGCCIGYGSNAVQCGDAFHCCPEGWTCSSQCALGSCSCLPPTVV